MLKFSIILLFFAFVCSENLKQSNDLASCIEAIKVLPSDIMKVIEDLRSFDIEKVIADVTILIADGKKAYTECFEQKEITLGTNWIEIYKCIRDFTDREKCHPFRDQFLAAIDAKTFSKAMDIYWDPEFCFQRCARFA